MFYRDAYANIEALRYDALPRAPLVLVLQLLLCFDKAGVDKMFMSV